MEKVIHYCWFGGKPLPKLAIKCINSWKKFCPDYKIIEWNEGNFDVNCCDYVSQAYAAKKYAFVSDYARFYILYHHGGVYFDTDVELLKPIDEIINDGNFFGCETDAPYCTVAPGLGMAAEKGLPFYKEMLEEYESSQFIKPDGSLNLVNVVTRTTEALGRQGLNRSISEQEVAGIKIYPKEYFNPCEMETGKIIVKDKTYSIHHYAASWVSKKDRFRGWLYKFVCRIFGKKFADKLKKFVR